MKKRITIRIDESTLEWFKAHAGPSGYQTLIDKTLRSSIQSYNEAIKQCSTDHSDPRLVDMPCSCQTKTKPKKKSRPLIESAKDIDEIFGPIIPNIFPDCVDPYFRPHLKQGKKAKK